MSLSPLIPRKRESSERENGDPPWRTLCGKNWVPRPRGRAEWEDAPDRTSIHHALGQVGNPAGLAELVADRRLRFVDKIDQQRPRVARVDDVFDRKRVRGAERRAKFVEPVLDFPPFRLGVVSRVDLAPIGGGDPAFDMHRTPVA